MRNGFIDLLNVVTTDTLSPVANSFDAEPGFLVSSKQGLHPSIGTPHSMDDLLILRILVVGAENDHRFIVAPATDAGSEGAPGKTESEDTDRGCHSPRKP